MEQYGPSVDELDLSKRKAPKNYEESPSANTRDHPHPNWRCKQCACPSNMTPMIRPGPLGKKVPTRYICLDIFII